MNDVTSLINAFFSLLSLTILARCLLSFIDPMARNQISRLIVDVTEPIVGPIRRFVPPLGGMIDLSPIIALFLLQFLQRLIVNSING